MKQLSEINKKLPLLLFIGILLLCLAFILINCGKGPQSKIINPDSRQCAIDFSDNPSNDSAVYFVSNELLNRQGTEITLEAWVKRNPSTTLNGTVISRHEKEGAIMWVKDNEPKFALRRIVGPTSTDFVVGSGVTLSEGTWHHLAGVLVNAVHSHPSSTSCTPSVMAETPHLDIYVDGEFKNCATTGSRSMSELTCASDSIGTGSCAGDTLGVGVSVSLIHVPDGGDVTFNGVIDEVRYYTTARTQSLIQACMNTELGLDGNCSRNSITLAAYMRLNECKGSAPSDWTGLGSGSKESPGGTPGWEGGWVSGAPITRKD